MNSSNSKGTSKRAVQKIRVRAILFLFLALAAGLGAVYLVKWYMDRVQSRVSNAPVNTVEVVVAALDIPVGTTLTDQVLTTVRWPAEDAPQGIFSSVKDVVDRTLIQSVVKGEVILDMRLADSSAGRGLAALLETGSRAMTVKVDQVVGVAGFIQPGDSVDVITTMAPDDETRKKLKNDAAKISKIILQNIKVLAIGEHIAIDASKPVKVQVVTLEVDPEQSERLALASMYGDIQLTMRSRIDLDSTPTFGITPLALLSPDKGSRNTQDSLAQRTLKTQIQKPEIKEPEQPPETPPSVVEILRGDRIEERKLKPTADSDTPKKK